MSQQSTTTTRRAMLAGAPAAAAGALAAGTAVNAMAVAMAKADEIDPIFAVIERHREAVKVYSDLHEAFEAVDALLPHSPPPDDYWDWPKAQRDAWQARYLAEWEERARDIGRGVAYDRWSDQGDLVAKIAVEFHASPPTTMAGVAAVLAHWAEIMKEDGDHFDFYGTQEFLENLSAALEGRS
jgi:hypothetical protein